MDNAYGTPGPGFREILGLTEVEDRHVDRLIDTFESLVGMGVSPPELNEALRATIKEMGMDDHTATRVFAALLTGLVQAIYRGINSSYRDEPPG